MPEIEASNIYRFKVKKLRLLLCNSIGDILFVISLINSQIYFSVIVKLSLISRSLFRSAPDIRKYECS
jgi:hypothetical protein